MKSRMKKLFYAVAGFGAIALLLAATAIQAQSNKQNPGIDGRSKDEAQSDGLFDVSEQKKGEKAEGLEGSWAITVTPVVPPGVPPPPPFQAYLTVSRGGGVIGSARNAPFAGPQHGTWVYSGGQEFAATLIQDLFDVMGNFQGTLTVRQKITIIGEDEFVGVANGESRDAAGNILFSRCTTTHGERIAIEPLAPQCQGIAPPR